MNGKTTFKDLSASGSLLFFGPGLLLISGANDLAVAFSIFYIFIGFTSAYQTGRELLPNPKKAIMTTAPAALRTDFSIRVQLAKERYAYNLIELEQLHRSLRIAGLESQLLAKNPQPYRSLPG